MITNQFKENIIQGLLLYVTRSFRLSFWSAFTFSINSLILSGFPFISFHLAEAWRYISMAEANFVSRAISKN